MNNNESYKFSDIVFPVIKVKMENGKAEFIKFLGSGFFIGDKGYFLTAKHVLNSGVFEELKDGEFITCQLFMDTFRLFPVMEIEEYPDLQVDMSIGFIPDCPIKEPNFFNINSESNVHGWIDIHAFGFPNYLLRDIPKEGQFQKGYVLRITQKGEAIGTFDNAPSSYILNFPIPSGMSGSPVFKIGKTHPLVGICLGSHEVSTTLWENTFLEEDDKKIYERKDRVIENGIALKITDYLDWEVKIANNVKLEDLFEKSV